jgi:hypothetical protein
MSKETKLSELVGLACLVAARDAARVHAVARGCPCYVVRTRNGFRCTLAVPTMGEHWRADVTGQWTHVAGIVT